MNDTKYKKASTSLSSRIRRVIAFIAIILVTVSFTTIIASASCDCGKVLNPDGTIKEHKEGNEYPCTKGWRLDRWVAFQMSNWRNDIGIHNADALFDFSISSEDGKVSLSASIWNVGKAIYNTVLPIGSILVILYCILNIIEGTTHDNLNPEQLIKIFIKLFLGIFLLSRGFDLLEGGINFSNSLLNLINGDKGFAGADNRAVYEMCKKAGTLNVLGLLLNSLMPYIISLGCSVVIYFMIYSRFIDITIRAAFAPIGMADIFQNGLNSNGIKYFKKFLAALLQGAVMAAILIGGNILSSALVISESEPESFLAGITNAAGVNDGGQLIIYLCVAGLLIKSKSIASDIIGV